MTQSKDMKSYLVKFAGTLIGALVLIVLVGYLYFFEIRKESEKAKKENILDRKSTRLNSSHGYISYAGFCLGKKIVDIWVMLLRCDGHHLVLVLIPLLVS